MRYGRFVIYLFTAAFLAVAVFFWLQEPEQEVEIPISVTVSSQGNTQNIRCWESEEGAYYVFLPSYAELSQAWIRTNTSHNISIDGQRLTDGMSCGCFQWNVVYDLTDTTKDGVQHFPLTFVRSENVPAMYIDVASGSMDYIHEEKGNEESGTIRLYTAEGELNYRGNLDSIEGRGNVTWTLAAKKPYNLKLSAQADLLGMGKAEKWILLANAFDASHLRNKIVYDFADAIGLPYSPESEWVDLYLNGEYAGLYLLCERNEVHPQRVQIAQEGSALVSMEVEGRLQDQGCPYLSTASGVSLRIHYATVSMDKLTQMWQSVENAIIAEDGIDPITGKQWLELIDLDSWAKKYLIEEVFGNMDGGSVSQFFYCDGSDETEKMYAGPVWDYDSSMNEEMSDVFFANRPYAWEGKETPWFCALYQKEIFYERVVELYQEIFLPQLTELLENGISQYAAGIAQAAAMNQIRWSEDDAAENTESIRSFLTERIALLNRLWLENAQYCFVLVNIVPGENSMNYVVSPGECLPSLSAYENNTDIIGWYSVDTDEPFDVAQPVYENTEIYLKHTDIATEQNDANTEYVSIMKLALEAGPIAVFAGILAIIWAVDGAQRRKKTKT